MSPRRDKEACIYTGIGTQRLRHAGHVTPSLLHASSPPLPSCMYVCTYVCSCCVPPRGQGAAKITIPPWPYLGISLRVSRWLGVVRGMQGKKCVGVHYAAVQVVWNITIQWMWMDYKHGVFVWLLCHSNSSVDFTYRLCELRGLAWDYNACTAVPVHYSVKMCKNAIRRRKHACIYSDKSACKRCKTRSSRTSCLKDHSTHACSRTPAMQAQPCHAQNPRNKSHIKR